MSLSKRVWVLCLLTACTGELTDVNKRLTEIDAQLDALTGTESAKCLEAMALCDEADSYCATSTSNRCDSLQQRCARELERYCSDVTDPDAGTSEPDASAETDAGVSEPDANTEMDSGVSEPDASAEPDSSTDPEPEPTPTCGDNLCDSAESCLSCESDCGACPSAAHEYYVSTSGSDSGSGSASSPWRTISHAFAAVPESGDAIIWVAPGTYNENVDADHDFTGRVRLISEQAYGAKLTAAYNPVLDIGPMVSIEGFEIVGQPTSVDRTGLIYMHGADDAALVNNVIHDSYDNDILRVLASHRVQVLGNVFYNPGDGEHTIDVNSGSQATNIEGNFFFNDFAASGRAGASIASFIVVKYSSGTQTTGNMWIRRNIFAHYEGEKMPLKIGADGELFAEAVNVTIENNLFHLAGPTDASGFEVVDARGVHFRANTFVGGAADDPFVGWVGTREGSPASEDINFVGNIFSASGQMQRLIESPDSLVTSGSIDSNLYWNGGQSIPSFGSDRLDISSDANAVKANPNLSSGNAVIPVWLGSAFAGGHATIEAAFRAYVLSYAKIDGASPAANVGFSGAPSVDILGNPRDNTADLGCFESR